MAGIKISDLPAAPSAQLTDVFPVDQLPGPVTYKESLQQVFTLFSTSAGQPLTEVDDTNVTLTLGGTPATALFQPVSITAGWTGTLSGTRGGTGVNNGASTITIGGSVTFSGAFTFAGTLTGNTAVTFPTSGTLATTSDIPSFPLSLTNGGTNASLVASNGGILYSTASAFAVLAGTATAGQILQSGASAAPSWSTTTYPATNAINTIMYASSANVLGVIAAANSSVMISSAGGVPSMSTTLPSGISATLMNLTTPRMTTIYDTTNSAPVFGFSGTASAVNYITAVSSAAGGGSVGLQFGGSDTNIAARLTSKGTGNIEFYNQLGGSGQPLLFLTGPLSNANSFQITGVIASSSPIFSVAGTDSNITMLLQSKGTGNITLQSTSTTIATFTPQASAVNNLIFYNNSTGANPIINATGSDSNIGLELRMKGTGGVNFTSGGTTNYLFKMNAVASPVNYIQVTNTATGGPPVLQATGSDANIVLALRGTGTGGVALLGYTDASSASAGYVGEIISSILAIGSATSLTTATAKNVTSISLTAGQWVVYGNINFTGTGVTAPVFFAWISATSATIPNQEYRNQVNSPGLVAANTNAGISCPFFSTSISTTTTIYLSAQANFSAGTTTACGGIFAIRVR
jgi:hypothetical protein